MLTKFIYDTGRGIIATYRGRNIFWHFLIVAVTYVLVLTGFDWWFFSVTRGELANVLGISSGIIGFFVPVLIPASLYIVGRYKNNKNLQKLAIKVVQAGIIALVIIAFYKAVTGRVEPEFSALVAINDVSRHFNFGFLERGIFWGWPSSHTGTAFAMSTFLAFWYKRNKWVSVIAILYASFIALGAAVSFHWFSDVISGIVIGTLIGYTVYKS